MSGLTLNITFKNQKSALKNKVLVRILKVSFLLNTITSKNPTKWKKKNNNNEECVLMERNFVKVPILLEILQRGLFYYKDFYEGILNSHILSGLKTEL